MVTFSFDRSFHRFSYDILCRGLIKQCDLLSLIKSGLLSRMRTRVIRRIIYKAGKITASPFFHANAVKGAFRLRMRKRPYSFVLRGDNILSNYKPRVSACALSLFFFVLLTWNKDRLCIN